jgi:hypothetical protein
MFELGQVLITRPALSVCEKKEVNATDFLRRHVLGDFGDLCAEDKAANRAAIKHGGRILSAYHVQDEKFYVITEADRSYTTILLASDY